MKTTNQLFHKYNTSLKKRLLPEPTNRNLVYIYQRFVVNLN